MEYDVRIEVVESRLVATARGVVSAGNLLERAIPMSQQAWDFLSAHPEIPQTGTNIWIYWDDGSGKLFMNGKLPMEPGAEVLVEFEPEEPITCSRTPAGRVATARHTGPYEGIPGAHKAISEWCEANGHVRAGPNWEVYGHWDPDPACLITDIYCLLS